MEVKGKSKSEVLREQTTQEIIDFLGYATSNSRTLRSCRIGYCNIVNILIRLGVVMSDRDVPLHKYKPELTIKEFINMVVNEYGDE